MPSSRGLCTSNELVVLDYMDVIDPTADLSDKIEAAYGYHGIGLLAVRNVPNYAEYRASLLPLARQFAMLPPELQARYEHPESYYSFGWSRGKEMLDGKPDTAKGSYYNNPQYDEPTTDPKLIQEYITFLHKNIWPTEDVPAMEWAFKNLGRTTCDIMLRLAMHCDSYVHKKQPLYSLGTLSHSLTFSRVTKARLLYYYPTDDESKAAEDHDNFSSWCGWHNDHGSLTGLASAMYFDDAGNEIPCPDDEAGLYIRTRQGEVVRPSPPPNCMMFQVGEAAQIQSGGWLQATPHSVRGASGPGTEGVGRATFAVFMQPEFWETMSNPHPDDAERVLRGASGELMPPGVPPLKRRWTPNQEFGDFVKATLREYH